MKLTLIRGLPGSGKSTLAKTLPAVHFEADMYFIADDGVYRYDKAKISDAHEWCRAEVKRALTNKQDVVVSNTFSSAGKSRRTTASPSNLAQSLW